MERRRFLKILGASLTGMALAPMRAGFAAMPAPLITNGDTMLTYPFTLPDLPYATDALAPVIDAETMSIHHGKHHQAYVTNLNNALKDHGELQKLDLLQLMARASEVPEAVRAAVRNNGGGHVNHSMFWQIMGKPSDNAAPAGELAQAIATAFGSFEEFRKKFNEAGVKQFGSGWVFVTAAADGKLAIAAKPNQDTPLMEGTSVLFGNDVWEHAYYLTYRNRRPDYLEAWWKILDWSKVAARYEQLKQKKTIV